MKLLPLDRPELIELAAGWLGTYDNYRWLDFGNGVQKLTPTAQLPLSDNHGWSSPG